MAKRVALEAFDLDHLGAELREDHRAVRARDVAGEVEHRDAVERRPFSATRASVFAETSRVGSRKPLQRRAIVAALRRRARDFAGRVVENDRHADLDRAAEGRIVDLLAHPERARLRMIDEFLARHHRRAWNVGLAQDAQPFVARPRADDRLEDVLERLPVLGRRFPTAHFRSADRRPGRGDRWRARTCPRRSRCRRRRTGICRRRPRTADRPGSGRADPAGRDRASSFFRAAGCRRSGARTRRRAARLRPPGLRRSRRARGAPRPPRSRPSRPPNNSPPEKPARPGLPLRAHWLPAMPPRAATRSSLASKSASGPRLPSGGTLSAIARGLMRRIDSESRPSCFSRAGVKPVTTMSAHRISSATRACDARSSRSRSSERLERLRTWKCGVPRSREPPVGSTLIARAPCSASSIAA